MIGIIDYGLGNIRAFANVYKRLNMQHKIVSCALDLEGVTKLILPGVGAFDHAMELFNRSGLREPVEDRVINAKTPVLGICVGMQILAKSSDEGTMSGLGWIDAEVMKLDVASLKQKTHLPHMGWNTVKIVCMSKLLDGLPEAPRFYFLHSYYFQCKDAGNEVAVSEYGMPFTCAVNAGNIYGVQFHPEKSHANGVQVLKNFAEIGQNGLA